MCVRIGKAPHIDLSALRENYISPEFWEEGVEADPFVQVWPFVKNNEQLICFVWLFYDDVSVKVVIAVWDFESV